jgi:hypothetical protein
MGQLHKTDTDCREAAGTMQKYIKMQRKKSDILAV